MVGLTLRDGFTGIGYQSKWRKSSQISAFQTSWGYRKFGKQQWRRRAQHPQRRNFRHEIHSLGSWIASYLWTCMALFSTSFSGCSKWSFYASISCRLTLSDRNLMGRVSRRKRGANEKKTLKRYEFDDRIFLPRKCISEEKKTIYFVRFRRPRGPSNVQKVPLRQQKSVAVSV